MFVCGLSKTTLCDFVFSLLVSYPLKHMRFCVFSGSVYASVSMFGVFMLDKILGSKLFKTHFLEVKIHFFEDFGYSC